MIFYFYFFYLKKAVKKALSQLGPLLQSDEINDFFQQALNEDKNVQYGEFTHKMTKLIVSLPPNKRRKSDPQPTT